MPEGLLILLARIPGIADVDAGLHLCDVRELPFEDDTFDAVICVHMLEHLPNPLVRLREMVRVLRPGDCCSSLPAAASWTL
jgi:ubiquinone/menaquinone biosynthesis C-methylase UbiE